MVATIVRNFLINSDETLAEYNAALADDQQPIDLSEDILNLNIEDFKLGYRWLRIKTADNGWKLKFARVNVLGLIVDGQWYLTRGEDFKRINCEE